MSEPTNLAAALLAAQQEMPAVEPDATNPHFGSRFVSLGHLIAKVRPVLNKHGVSVMQMPSQDEQGRPALTTRLIHTGGEVMESTMPLLLSKQDPQGLGSALTYARRYALAAALAISDQEDDDGNVATASETAPAPEPEAPGFGSSAQKKRFVGLLEDAGLSAAEISGVNAYVSASLTPKAITKSCEGLEDPDRRANGLKYLRDKAGEFADAEASA